MNGQKLTTLIVCALILAACDQKAQQPPTPYDDLVQREGKCFAKFSDVPFSGRTSGQFIGRLNDGLWQGKVAWFNEKGQLNARYHFKDGLLDGLVERFEDGGRLRYSQTFRDGVLQGESKLFSSRGEVAGSLQYESGTLKARLEFHNNGVVKKQASYEEGVLNGRYAVFARNGEEEFSLTFKEGRAIETTFRSFHRYTDTDWDFLHPIDSEVSLTGGLANGVSKHYFVGDKPTITATWKDDRLDGICKERDGRKGHPDPRYYFKGGDYIETRYFDAQGKEVEGRFLRQDEGKAYRSCNKLPGPITKQSSYRGYISDAGQKFITCGPEQLERYWDRTLSDAWQ